MCVCKVRNHQWVRKQKLELRAVLKEFQSRALMLGFRHLLRPAFSPFLRLDSDFSFISSLAYPHIFREHIWKELLIKKLSENRTFSIFFILSSLLICMLSGLKVLAKTHFPLRLCCWWQNCLFYVSSFYVALTLLHIALYSLILKRLILGFWNFISRRGVAMDFIVKVLCCYPSSFAFPLFIPVSSILSIFISHQPFFSLSWVLVFLI